jgi:hypothetical protein
MIVVLSMPAVEVVKGSSLLLGGVVVVMVVVGGGVVGLSGSVSVVVASLVSAMVKVDAVGWTDNGVV